MRNKAQFRKSTNEEVTPSDLLRNSGYIQPLYARLPLDTYLQLVMMSTIRKMPMSQMVSELIEAEWDNVKDELGDPAPKDKRRILVALEKSLSSVLNRPGKEKS